MIPSPLHLLARTLPLSDAGLLEKVMKRLLSKGARVEKGWLHGHTPQALEAHYPRRFRPNEASLAARQVVQDYSSSPDGLDWLDAMFEEYYRFDGNRVVAHEDKRLEYASLCAKLHPALPVAWHLSGLMNKARSSQPDFAEIHRLIDATAPSFLPPSEGDNHWADLHVHLGGAHETSLSLFSLAISNGKLPQNADFPSLDHAGIDKKCITRWLSTYQSLFHLLLRRLGTINPIDPTETSPYREILRTAWTLGHSVFPALVPNAWLKLHRSKSGHLPEMARRAISCMSRDDAHSAWLYWLTALCLLYRKARRQDDRDAIHAFFILSQLLREDMVHNGIGLSRFVRYFNSPIRRAPKGEKCDINGLRQLLEPKQHCAEIKVTEWIANKQEATKFVCKAAEFLYPLGKTNQQEAVTELLKRMHTCIHFLRSPHKVDPYKMRNEAQRREVFSKAMQINNFLQSASAMKWKIHGTVVNLPKLIRALDVAGDELTTPIEVFAPAIRWLRRNLNMVTHTDRGLHLSIHAGEDYNHLLGGLRQIDETVHFCGMTKFDRLGHALALGITPRYWLENQPDIVITLEEHLDNLVWAWHQGLTLKTRISEDNVVLRRSDVDTVIANIEDRIRIYAPLVYPQYADELTPDALYKAWLLRRNCPIKWNEHSLRAFSSSTLKFWVPDEADTDKKSLPYRLYHAYYKVSRRPETVVNKRDHVLLVRCGEKSPASDPWNDWISDMEMDFIEAIQDLLLEDYANLGLIIEVNPSSNVYVGHIDDYSRHPIFRWTPPSNEWLKDGKCYNRFGLRKKPIQVCINTDDPGIFPTTLQNEFCLLKAAAENHHQINPKDSARWIDEIRQFGINQFDLAHVQI